MKTLLILRHGKSSWDDEKLADHERPLARRGKESANRVGRLLKKKKLVPDAIISSTAVRARKTAAKVAKEISFKRAIELDERLYLASVLQHVAVVRASGRRAKRLLIVGHNPGISEFLDKLTGADEELPTGALAVISLKIKDWKELGPKTRGKLVEIRRPRELK